MFIFISLNFFFALQKSVKVWGRVPPTPSPLLSLALLLRGNKKKVRMINIDFEAPYGSLPPYFTYLLGTQKNWKLYFFLRFCFNYMN